MKAEARDVFKAHLDEMGYAVVDDLIDADELQTLGLMYNTWLAQRITEATAERGPDFLKLGHTLWVRLNTWEHVAIEQMACHAAIKAAAAIALDRPADQLTVALRMFFKPARVGQAMPWHQDEAHKDPRYDHLSVNVWMPLDEAPEAAGCLRYLPGSHRGPVQHHEASGPDVTGVSVHIPEVDDTHAHTAPLSPGQAVIHPSRTVHSSGPNTTGHHRRALVAVVSAPPVPREVPHHRPWMTGDPDQVPERSF